MKTAASRCVKNIVVSCPSRWKGLCFTPSSYNIKGRSECQFTTSLYFFILILNSLFIKLILILLVGGYIDYADIGITIELVKYRNIYPPFPIFLSYHIYIFINNFDLAFHLWIKKKSYLRDLCKPKTLKTNT